MSAGASARKLAGGDALVASDVETRATADHHDTLRLWLRLLATTNLIEERVRRLLQERFATTLPRFDLMAQLERVPDGLKMGELSRRMMVTGGNVTGITDLLEREGLVARVTDRADRRAYRVRLTAAGRRAFRAMAEQHEGWIAAACRGLGAREVSQLVHLLGRLKTNVRALEDAEK
jgi:DNA-binding MarR family transcriptional regulator